MNANLTIAISIVCAAMSGLGMYAAHVVATKWHWRFLHRYVAGVVIASGAFAIVLFAYLPLEPAAALLLALVLIYGASGLGTWLGYEHDGPSAADAAEDEVLRKLNQELKDKD